MTNPRGKQLVGRDRPLCDHPIQVIGSDASRSGPAVLLGLVVGWDDRRVLEDGGA